MTARNYYPLPAAISGGGDLVIANMYAAGDAKNNLYQYATSDPRATISKQFTAKVLGGTPPYAYDWELVSGTITCNNPAIQNPFFAASGSQLGNITTAFGTWSLTVTDAASATDTKFIEFRYYFGSPVP